MTSLITDQPREILDEQGTHERLASIARELRRLAGLDRLAQKLASAPSMGELFERVLVGIPSMIDGVGRADIFVADARGALERAAGFGDDGGEALQAICGNDVAKLTLHGPKRWSSRRGRIATAPLMARSELVGLVVVERTSPRDFDAADLATLGSIATHTCLVVERLRAEERSRTHARRWDSDLEMARRIQRRFLPTLPVQVGGLRVAAEYRPAFDVGGDFYDLIPLRDGGILAVIGDVSGKGIAAALIMARVTSELRRLAQSCASPAALLGELNRILVDIGSDDAFVTAACIRFDVTRTRIVVANAGHVPPVVRRASGETRVLGEASGAPLAMLPDEQYRDEEFTLDGGDVLLLMTDGITEGVDRCANPLDMSRLLDLIRESPHQVSAISARILADVEAGRSRRTDDLALLALQIPAAG